MKAIKFKNFSDKDFVWNFDSIPYEFPAGQETFMEDFKAEHFAKHLVDREMNKLQGLDQQSPVIRKQLEEKCFPKAEAVTPAEAINIEATKADKVKEVSSEVEFPDLN